MTMLPLSRDPTELAEQLGARYPIIQAPMAGGVASPALVTAVGAAGAIGSLGCGMMTPGAMRKRIADIRSLGCDRFAVNIFVLDSPNPDVVELREAHRRLEPYYTRFGLSSALPQRFCESTDEHVAVALELEVPIVSFTFGLLDRAMVRALRNNGTRVIGTATTLEEALAWQEAGADAVCAQGLEAGGHRGTFASNLGAEQYGTLALVSTLKAHVEVPIIAAGGIMDGAGIIACLTLGASAVQLGTAFLCADEAGTHPAWKKALMEQTSTETALTVAFSGRPARALRNRFVDEWAPASASVPPYPIQNALTMPIRKRASEASDVHYMSLWAGQGHAQCHAEPAGAIVRRLVTEAEDAQRAVATAATWLGAE